MSDLAPLAEAVTVDPLVGHPADYHVFHQFLDRCKNLPAITTAVVWPLSGVALRGAVEAAEEGLIEPTLIGDEAEMKALAREIGVNIDRYPTLQADTESKAAELGCLMCRSGNAQAIMKGSLHTDELMRAAMNKDTGLRTNRRISHVFVMDTPAYPRTLLITDAAINITPELEDKVHIVQNAIDLAHALGIPEPKVALLSAVETVNPKIKSTLDAAALCKMADRGQITGGILDGPLAFDTAVSARAAEIKKLQSPVVGQADILVVPDLESGNMLAKQLE
jgi:phosphate acetyltransferase